MGRKGSAKKIRQRLDGPKISDGPFGYLAGNGDRTDYETPQERNLRMLHAQHDGTGGQSFPEGNYSQGQLRGILRRKEF